MPSPAWICLTCGVQHAATPEPPKACPICEDERQYVGWDGQRWTTADELLALGHRCDIRQEEPGLLGIGVSPSVGIGQRALVVVHPEGNVMWDCIPIADGPAREAVTRVGGLAHICFSHPHFYGAAVDWAEAFGARIWIPAPDRMWVMRPSPLIEVFEQPSVSLGEGLTLTVTGGHFDGAAVLHWAAGAGGRGALLTGDTVTVVPDRRWVSFMWSYPNLIPLDPKTVTQVADRVATLPFERIYGGWWGRVVLEDGPGAVRRSAQRYLARLSGARPGTEPEAVL